MFTIDLHAGWSTLFEGDHLRLLETRILPDFLIRQRWYSGKSREIKQVRLRDVTATSANALLPANTALALLEVHYATGLPESYFLPLAVAPLALASEPFKGQVAVVKLAKGEQALIDGSHDQALATAILKAIATSAQIPMRQGQIRATPTSAFETLKLEPGKAEPRLGQAEQSHTAIRFGDRAILKLYRRLEAGLNPELEIGRFFSEKTSYRNVPLTAGSMEYLPPEPAAEPVTLSLLQAFVPNQGTAWEHALSVLRNDLENVGHDADKLPPAALRSGTLLDHTGATPPPDVIRAFGDYFPFAAMLGKRTAEMHLALSSRDDVAGFQPLPITRDDLATWAAEARDQVESSLDLLRSVLKQLPAPVISTAGEVLQARDELLEMLSGLAHAPACGHKIRIHGDYHLGQVLVQNHDFVLLDFEGEPVRPLSWRRQPHTAWKDVAGMLRSFDYAANAALFELTQDHANDQKLLAPWAAAWSSWISEAFLRRYLETAGKAAFLCDDQVTRAALFRAFLLDKSLYELQYELNHRPRWVMIPLRGILSLLESPEPTEIESPLAY